jgi:hypothetical protein
VVSVRSSSRTLVHRDAKALPVGWSAEGSSVYALDPEQRRILQIPAGGGPPLTLFTLPFDRVGRVDITPDARRIVANVPETQADVWLVENFEAGSN